MEKDLEITEVYSNGNRTYYLVNNYLPVLKHTGWCLVRGKNSYCHPPFVLEDAPSSNTLEELVKHWYTHIAPYKVHMAMELIKFYEGLQLTPGMGFDPEELIKKAKGMVANFADNLMEVCKRQDELLDDAIRRNAEGDISVYDGFMIK